MDAWYDQLRSIRERCGMSRHEAADRCGLSAHSLRSYEVGRRRPTRDHLLRLLKCLNVGDHARNVILASAGLAPEGPIDRFREPNVPPREAARMTRSRPLPALLLNDRTEVLAVSGAAWRLFGMPEYEAHPPKHRGALTELAARAVAARVQNWDEAIGQILQFAKAGLPRDRPIDEVNSPIAATVRKLAADEPAMWKRFEDLWRVTRPFRGRMTGHIYPSVWSVPGGAIRFNVFIGCLNTEVGLYIHAMVPADARSHMLLEEVLAGRGTATRRSAAPRRVGSRSPSRKR
jgi:transcriptional regulator with XRE-family HTH domain